MQIVTTHRNSDFDALAATMAATLLYPTAIAVFPRSLNPNVKAFLSIHKDLFDYLDPAQIDPADVQRLIVVDVNRWNRLDALRKRTDLEVFVFDHHMTAGDIKVDRKYQEKRGATVTLLVRHLRKLRTDD